MATPAIKDDVSPPRQGEGATAGLIDRDLASPATGDIGGHASTHRPPRVFRLSSPLGQSRELQGMAGLRPVSNRFP